MTKRNIYRIVWEEKNIAKGKPWPVDDEKKLKDWFTSEITDLRVLAFSFEGSFTEEGIGQKLIKFDLMKEHLCEV